MIPVSKRHDAYQATRPAFLILAAESLGNRTLNFQTWNLAAKAVGERDNQ
jgi:hypothetical protein